MALKAMMKDFAARVQAKAELTVSDVILELETGNDNQIQAAIHEHYMDVAGDLGVPVDLREQVVEIALK